MKLNPVPLLAILLIGIGVISGCIEATPLTAPTSPSPVPQAGAPTENKDITTAITPARDLTGEWESLSSSATWRDNVVNWACSYEGYFYLSLKQNGNNLAGTFTSDLMQGTFESCPDQICADGTGATGSIGEFKVTRQR